MQVDPEDTRPPYQQIANQLRAAILNKTYQPGDKLPSVPELTKQLGVAKMTAQRAVQILRDEGLVIARQGSGVYVRERTQRPVDLRGHLEHAFEQPTVTVDFAGFSGETLHGALTEPLDKIRAGRLTPEALRVRLLVPDPSAPWSLPARVDDLTDSPAFRDRATTIMRRHTLAIVEAVNELADLGIVPAATAQIRAIPVVPLFKLYLINDSEMFFGYYPVQEHTVKLNGEPTAIWDLMGKDAILFHQTADADVEAVGSQYVQQSRMWFDSIWSSVARDLEL